MIQRCQSFVKTDYVVENLNGVVLTFFCFVMKVFLRKYKIFEILHYPLVSGVVLPFI